MKEAPWLPYEFPNILYGGTFLPGGNGSLLDFNRQRLEFLDSKWLQFVGQGAVWK